MFAFDSYAQVSQAVLTSTFMLVLRVRQVCGEHAVHQSQVEGEAKGVGNSPGRDNRTRLKDPC